MVKEICSSLLQLHNNLQVLLLQKYYYYFESTSTLQILVLQKKEKNSTLSENTKELTTFLVEEAPHFSF
jgi:hypothetical protein